jgi:cytochrome o ubiquinol oxidase subunit IV
MSGQHEHHDDHHAQGDGIPHSTLGGYAAGFILSVFLTSVPFALVMGRVFDSSVVTSVILLAFAAVQIVVHMVFFLHMNTRAEGGWSMLALIFTVALVVITLSGSLWVMYHMNSNMMPSMHHQLHEAP